MHQDLAAGSDGPYSARGSPGNPDRDTVLQALRREHQSIRRTL